VYWLGEKVRNDDRMLQGEEKDKTKLLSRSRRYTRLAREQDCIKFLLEKREKKGGEVKRKGDFEVLGKTCLYGGGYTSRTGGSRKGGVFARVWGEERGKKKSGLESAGREGRPVICGTDNFWEKGKRTSGGTQRKGNECPPRGEQEENRVRGGKEKRTIRLLN